MFRTISKLVTCTALLAVLAACQPIQPPGGADKVRVATFNGVVDIDMGIPQQDVYVQLPDKPENEIYRITIDQLTDELRNAPAWRTTEVNYPDLFGLTDNPVGPYPKGDAHDFTFGDFISANGEMVYTKGLVQDHFKLEAVNLRPDAVYTMWCVFTWVPPIADGKEWPCGAADGSDSIFQSSAEGTLSVERSIPLMPYSTDTRLSSLCLAYHSNGETHGFSPGEYGKNTHVQVCWDVPYADSELWQDQPASFAASSAQTVSEDAIREELMAMEDKFWKCQAEKDMATCEAITAQDFFLIFDDGSRVDRAGYLAPIADPNVKFETPKIITPISAQSLSPDAAVIAYGFEQKVNGEATKGYNSIGYKKVNGQWQAAYATFMFLE